MGLLPILYNVILEYIMQNIKKVIKEGICSYLKRHCLEAKFLVFASLLDEDKEEG